jgi:MoxR-like ATPase
MNMDNKIAVEEIIHHMEKVMIGKSDVLKLLYVSILNDGHVLLEDVPGVGKTLMVATLARAVNGIFNRVQFTPDVMPSDIMGFSMFNPSTREFEYREGAAICNFLLGDEINRASPKTQSSLLEIMEEYQVTVDGNTYPIEKPFIVFATQNPIESFGTFPLPEAQMDRFFIRLSIGYPSQEEEKEIIDRFGITNPLSEMNPIASTEDLKNLQTKMKEVNVDEKIKEYIVKIVSETRRNEKVTLGVSPRGSLHLFKAVKAWAYIQGRDYVLPDDVQYLCPYILSHRIIMSSAAKIKKITPEDILDEAIQNVKVPTE